MPGISTPMGKKVLDAIFGGVFFEPPAAIHVRLYTVAPTDGYGNGGTEVTGGMVRPTLVSGTAADGSAGRRAQIAGAQPLVFESIDQPASMIVHASFHDDDTGEMVWDTPWSPDDTEWAAGGSPMIPAANIINAFTG